MATASPGHVLAARLAVGSVVATGLLWPAQWQPVVDAAWTWLCGRALYRVSGRGVWTVCRVPI